MLYSLNTLLLVGAIASLPTGYATPLPQYSLPFLNGTLHQRRSWNGTIVERRFNGTNTNLTTTPQNAPITLHQELNETHPYFQFLSKRTTNSSTQLRHHNRSSRTKANSTGIVEPSTANITPPPSPKYHPEVFDPSIYTVKAKKKRQIQYGSPPPFELPDASAQYGPPLDPPEPAIETTETEEERAETEGPETPQIPPGKPAPDSQGAPSPDAHEKRSMATNEQLLRERRKEIKTFADAEEMKQLVREMSLSEDQRKPVQKSISKRKKITKEEGLKQGMREIRSFEDAEALKNVVRKASIEEEKGVQRRDVAGLESEKVVESMESVGSAARQDSGENGKNSEGGPGYDGGGRGGRYGGYGGYGPQGYGGDHGGYGYGGRGGRGGY